MLTAEEVASKVYMNPVRLKDLALSGYAPHWRVDGGEPLFTISELKEWIDANLLQKRDGVPLPITIRPVVDWGKETSLYILPTAIRLIPNLRILPEVPCGVYFLCHKDEVVYVGQSVLPAARIAQHSGKQYDRSYFLAIPQEMLDEVEGALIRWLKPKLNGKISPRNTRSDDETLTYIGAKEREEVTS